MKELMEILKNPILDFSVLTLNVFTGISLT